MPQIEPAATISIVSPDDESIRAVFGLYPDSSERRMEFKLIEDQSRLMNPYRYMKVLNTEAEQLNKDIASGSFSLLNSEWKEFKDPNGRRLFKDAKYGGATYIIVKTTIDPGRIGELGRLLENTYGKENSTFDLGPEASY